MRIDWYVLGFVVLISQSSARQIGFEPGPSAKGFFARGKTYTLTLSPDEAALRLDKSVLRMKLLGAGAGAGAEPLEQLPGKANYFIGNDPAQWRTNVPMYAKVAYREVYRGVDLIYYGNQGSLEYDFVISPGTDPKSVRLAFEGADRIAIDSNGELLADGLRRQILK